MAPPRKYPDELPERAIRFALDLVEGAEKLPAAADEFGLVRADQGLGGGSAVGGACGNVPPVEFEDDHYRSIAGLTEDSPAEPSLQ